MSSSNLVVKMMSGEDMPDNDTSKGFTLVEAFGEVRCLRDENNEPIVDIPMEDGMTSRHRPKGNTYVMKNGKTVATFSFGLQQAKVEVIQGSAVLGGDKLKRWATNDAALAQSVLTDATESTSNPTLNNGGAYRAMKATHPENFYKSIVDNWNAYKFFPNWIYNKDNLKVPKGKDDVLIILSGLLTKDVLQDLTEAGYVVVDKIINPTIVDISFQVLIHKDFSDCKPMLKLPQDIVTDIVNEVDADKWLRVPVQDLPFLVYQPLYNRGSSSTTKLIENFYKHEPNLSVSPNGNVHSLNITAASAISYANRKAVVEINAKDDTITLDQTSLYVNGRHTAIVGKSISFIVIHNCDELDTIELAKIAKDLGFLGYNHSRDIDTITFWYAHYSSEVLKHQNVIDDKWTESDAFKDGKPNVIMVPCNHLTNTEALIKYFNYKPFKTVYTLDEGLCVLLQLDDSVIDPTDESAFKTGEVRKGVTTHIRDVDLLKFLLTRTSYSLLPDVFIPESDAADWANNFFSFANDPRHGYRKVRAQQGRNDDFELIKSELC